MSGGGVVLCVCVGGCLLWNEGVRWDTVGQGSLTAGPAAQVSHSGLPQLIEHPSLTGWDSVSLATMEVAQTAQQLTSSVVLFAEFSELHCHCILSRVRVFGAWRT